MTRKSKQDAQTVLQFQVRSYTLLVQRLFHTWKSRYSARKHEHELQVKKAELSALDMARAWRRKAQTSRGHRVKAVFQQRKVSHSLQVIKIGVINFLSSEIQYSNKSSTSKPQTKSNQNRQTYPAFGLH